MTVVTTPLYSAAQLLIIRLKMNETDKSFPPFARCILCLYSMMSNKILLKINFIYWPVNTFQTDQQLSPSIQVW